MVAKHQWKQAGKGGHLKHISSGVAERVCWNVFHSQGAQTVPWEPMRHKMLRWGLFKMGLRGIYDPGDFTKPFHRFSCSSHNSPNSQPSSKNLDFPQRKWRREKRYQRDQNCACVNIRNQMVARSSAEKRLRSFPLTGVQPVKINVSTSPRKYSLHDLPIPPSTGGFCSS